MSRLCTQLFINNEYTDCHSGSTFPVTNPADQTVLANVQQADEIDVNTAVAAAKSAFQRNSRWRCMNAGDRGALLLKLADQVEANIDYIAKLETDDGGLLAATARGQVLNGALCLRYYAGWADKLYGRTYPTNGNFFSYSKRHPVGVVGLLTPWNAPFYLLCMKLGPALAAGCTIVIKPSELTPLSSIFLGTLCKKVGIPAGVVNIITGMGPTVGAAMTNHKDIAKIAFTGSTQTGKIIAAACATSNLKRVTLELGGKSPAIIFPDVDLDNPNLWGHKWFIFRNSGQVCIAASRIFVHEDIYDAFIAKAVALAKSQKLGHPTDPTVTQGPQISERQFNHIMAMIEAGKSEGARLVCGGNAPKNIAGCEKGFFVEPTVFADVEDHMTIARQEIFGPVMQILKFSDKADVIRRANDTQYGLGAAVFSKDMNVCHEVAEALEAGSVWVNCYGKIEYTAPFGGTKCSGIGKEMGDSGVDAYLEDTIIHMAVDTKNS